MKQSGMNKIVVGMIAGVVLILALFGLGVYQALTHETKKPNETVAPSPSPQSTNAVDDDGFVPAAASANPKDDEQVTTLARTQCEGQYGGLWKGWSAVSPLQFSADSLFAYGISFCPPKGQEKNAASYQFSLAFKRLNGKWESIYRGVNPPCSQWAKQWGAPADWAVTPVPAGAPEGVPQAICGS